MEALDNAWYGSWRPLTNLTQTFRACHLCTFNVAAIFWGGHPYIWRATVRHDNIQCCCRTFELVLPSTGQVTILGEITFQLNTDLSTDPPVFTLTCTSTGGPATTVSWSRDGITLSDDSNHDITSQVMDTVTATYTNTLTVTGRLAGQYECSVSNSRTPSGSTRSLRLGKALEIQHLYICKKCLVVLTTEWLPWLQTSWEDSGYEKFILVLEANCISNLSPNHTLQLTTVRTSLRESLKLHMMLLINAGVSPTDVQWLL